MNKVPLDLWAEIANIDLSIARNWAREGLLEGAKKPLLKDWTIPLGTKSPNKVEVLERSTELFRKKYWSCVLYYEADPCEATRARWTKEEVMQISQWPYPQSWRLLRDELEAKVGLIMLLKGARHKGDGVIRPWTFATCQEDRELAVIHATRCQIGGMRRTAKVVSQALEPGDERHALDKGSKTNIDRVLKEQDVKLDNVLRTLQDVKQDLLDRDTMKLLEEYNER